MPLPEPSPDPSKTDPLKTDSGPESRADVEAEPGLDSDLGGDVEDGMEDAETAETMGAEAQPDPGSRVEEDMATIALGQSIGAPSGLTGAGFDAARSVTASELSAMSDAEIMLRVREGDDSGFEYLIHKYHKPMIHFMFRMVHNQAVAEELAQEVFLRVYRSRQSYRAEAKFTTWLYRIATNLGVNHARDTKYERAAQNVYLDQPDPETGTTPDVADLTASVEQELVRDERMRAIRQHVLALPERQRAAVLMHKYQGLDYKQIGEVLKLSESATKSLLFRAYQTLRERLKDFV
jgi:RNA polymerase sigma-70 factor, ECF subfamily